MKSFFFFLLRFYQQICVQSVQNLKQIFFYESSLVCDPIETNYSTQSLNNQPIVASLHDLKRSVGGFYLMILYPSLR